MKNKRMQYSILQDEDDMRCYVCGCTGDLEVHHVWFGPNRHLSDDDGLICYLCHEHHRGNSGVHHNKSLDEELKAAAEYKWCQNYELGIDDFIARYGRNVL